MFSRVTTILSTCQRRNLNTGLVLQAVKNNIGKGQIGESERMKKFRDKLKSNVVPDGGPGMQFDDLVLVETDPKSGEAVANGEKDPTKWGDWQNGGRVSDF